MIAVAGRRLTRKQLALRAGALLLATIVGALLLVVIGGPLLAIASWVLHVAYWVLTVIIGVLWLLKELILFLVGRSWGLWVLAGLLVLGAVGALTAFLDSGSAPAATRVGTLEEPCHGPDHKVKFDTEHDAQQEVARNQDRYRRGLVDYRLERSYVCELCGWWHNTSHAER